MNQEQAIWVPPAKLMPLQQAILHQLQGQPVQLDLRFLAAQPPQAILATDMPVLAVRVSGRAVHLACFPAAQKAGVPCTECLERRTRSMHTIDEQWASHLGYWVQASDCPFLLDSVCETIALLCAYRYAQQGAGAQEVLTLDLISMEARIDELMGDAFCSACAPALIPSEEGARLTLRRHLLARSGLSRLKGLLEYRLPTKALINPVCGAAAPFAVPGHMQSIIAPVFAQYLQRAFDARPRMIGWSGLCLRSDESNTAGLLEAFERQAGMLTHPATTAVVDSYQNLQNKAMDPALCFAYNEESYQRDLGLTRYRHDLSIEWVWGYSLMQQRPILVPRQLAYYGSRHAERRPKLVDNNSSGCALGACYEEAILKGLLELIERDSFVLTWHRQLSLPKIDPASCTDRKTRLVLNRMDYLGFEITLLDGRMDMRIPAVIAIARRRDGGLGAMTVGASASLDPAEAVRSALLECATPIVEMPAMFRAQEKHVRSLMLDYSKVTSVMDHSLLYAIPEMAAHLSWLHSNSQMRSFVETFGADQDFYAKGDIGEDLRKVLDELQACEMHEAVVVDLTTPEQRELDLRTVRVLVPGLAPIDFGHPRNRVEHLPRLYSAPLCKNLSSPLGATGNPLPHPFP